MNAESDKVWHKDSTDSILIVKRSEKIVHLAWKERSFAKSEDDRNGGNFMYVNLEDIAGTMICTPSMKDPRVRYVT